MPYNLDRESSSFWKIWKGGTHAAIVSEILADEEFRIQAEEEIADANSQQKLVAKVVRMTGRRIGQEIARKASVKVKRSIHSNDGSVFMILPEGTSEGLTTATLAHPKVQAILADLDPDHVDEVVQIVSRMVGRAVGSLLGVNTDPTKILSLAKSIIEKIG